MENNRINIDDIDLKIIYNLYNLKKNEQITTYELAKRIFDMSNDRNAKNSLITTRLQRLSRYGLIDIKRVGENMRTTNYYDLMAEKVAIKRLKIASLNIDKKAMLINIYDNWNVFLREFLV